VKTVDRLDKYLQIKEISPSVFERTCDLSNGYFARQLNVSGSIGSDILEKIAEAYPDLNIAWLITGKGAMITKPPTTTRDDEQANLLLEEEQAEYKKKIGLIDDAKKILDQISAIESKKKEKGRRKKKS
jgi:hypothetical protein